MRRAAAGTTLIELLVVIVVLSVLILLAVQGPKVKAQAEAEHNAQLRLKTIWTSEKRYYAFNSNSVYTNGWQALNLADPSDGFYSYSIIVIGGGTNFTATATPTQPGLRTFTMDQTGIVSRQ